MAVDATWEDADVQGLKAVLKAAFGTFRDRDKDAAAAELQAELDRPEVRGLFGRFDAAVDRELERLTR